MSEAKGTFFWKTVLIQQHTALDYSRVFVEIIHELEDAGIKVSLYASDNCNTMIATESIVHSL